jgi:hypothetical protein
MKHPSESSKSQGPKSKKAPSSKVQWVETSGIGMGTASPGRLALRLASRLFLIGLISALSAQASIFTLTFNQPGGGVVDTNGVGTGFPVRMPGTGGNVSGNDTNLLLNTSAHVLTMHTSPGLDFNGAGGVQPGVADSSVVGVMLSTLGFHATNDFFATAVFTNIPPDLPTNGTPPPFGYVLQPDQLCLVVGTHATNLVRCGFINFDRVGGNAALVRDNEDFGVNTVNGGDLAAVFFGSDVGTGMVCQISRSAGTWSITVNGRNCMPNTAIQRNGTPVPPAQCDGQDDLFVGVCAMDVVNDSPWTADLVSFTVNVIEQQTAPVISSQPQKRVVNEGNPASFAVSLTQSTASPVSYQWQKNGAPIDGQTSSSLGFFALAADGANYTVVVSNALGVTTSSVAPLAVILPSGSLALSFTSAGGGILDSNGVGTGFPDRLPGTGTAFVGNDTNLFMDTGNGVLVITSTSGDYNTGANEPINESPGVSLASLGFTGSEDLNASLVFPTLSPTVSFDQAGLYVGIDTNYITRAGWIDFTAFGSPKGKEQYSENITPGGNNSPPGTVAPGNGPGGHYFGFPFDPAILPCTVRISRTAGIWHYYIDGAQWDPANPTFLNGATNLTAGIFIYDTGGGAYTQAVSNFAARVFKGLRLKVTRSGSNLVFNWNVAGPTGLQSNTSLTNPNGWVTVPGVTSNSFTMPIPANSPMFFRVVE